MRGYVKRRDIFFFLQDYILGSSNSTGSKRRITLKPVLMIFNKIRWTSILSFFIIIIGIDKSKHNEKTKEKFRCPIIKMEGEETQQEIERKETE